MLTETMMYAMSRFDVGNRNHALFHEVVSIAVESWKKGVAA